MATSALAEAFARLSTSDSRLNALEALMKHLTPYEWRFVQSLVNTRTFHFDIIGRLPVELVSHIFSYLDTCAPWRLQHVSRSWYQSLRNLAVLKPSLDSWYNGTVNFQGVDLDFCWRKARSVFAFRSGSQSASPDSSFKISAQFSLTEQLLRGDHLIWLTCDRRQVHVLNLRSLALRTIVPVARELLRSVYASDDLVAVTADAGGIVYVSELAGQGPLKKFRSVTSSRNFALTCRQRTVACTALQQHGVLVYIWNYDTQQGRSFTITSDTPILSGNQLNFPTFISDLGLLLQPDTETIVLCLFVRQTNANSDSAELLYYQSTYLGECLHGAKQVLEENSDYGILTDSGVRKSIKFTPASHDGLFMFHCNAWISGPAVKTVCMLQFDENRHVFTRPQHPRLHSVDKHDRGHIVWWKDTFVEAGTKDNIVIHKGTISDPCDVPVLTVHPSNPIHRSTQERQIAGEDLLINERYIIRPYCDAFYVYCYDHTVHLPGKEGILNSVGPWEVIEPRFASVSKCTAAMAGT